MFILCWKCEVLQCLNCCVTAITSRILRINSSFNCCASVNGIANLCRFVLVLFLSVPVRFTLAVLYWALCGRKMLSYQTCALPCWCVLAEQTGASTRFCSNRPVHRLIFVAVSFVFLMLRYVRWHCQWHRFVGSPPHLVLPPSPVFHVQYRLLALSPCYSTLTICSTEIPVILHSRVQANI